MGRTSSGFCEHLSFSLCRSTIDLASLPTPVGLAAVNLDVLLQCYSRRVIWVDDCSMCSRPQDLTTELGAVKRHESALAVLLAALAKARPS